MKNMLRHPKLVLGIIFAITLFFAIPLRKIKIESSIRQFFPKRHEAYSLLTKTENQFGSMVAIGISLETFRDTIIRPEYIQTIRKITADLENVPNTSNVTSLTNIDYIADNEGTIEVGPLLPDTELEDGTIAPISAADLETIKTRLADWEDMYDLVIISKDGRGTQISLSVDHTISVSEQNEILDQIRKLVTDDLKNDNSDLSVKFYGDPVISSESKSFMISDLVGLIPLIALVVLISLFCSFSTLDGTVLPLITVLISTIWSVGLMTLMGFEFSIISSVIPVVLIACGSAYGIHVLTHYYIAVDEKRKELDANRQSFTKEIHTECILKGMKNVSVAVVLSAITTVAGFISLVTSPLPPLFSFAIFSAVGIALSLLFSVTLIPCFLVQKKIEHIGRRSRRMERLTARLKRRIEKLEFSRIKKSYESAMVSKLIKIAAHGGEITEDDRLDLAISSIEGTDEPGVGNTLYSIYHVLCGTKPRMVIFSLLILILSITGLTKIVIDTSMVNYFPETSRLRQDINYVNDNFAGTNAVYLLIHSPAGDLKAEAENLYAKANALREPYEKENKEIPASVQEEIEKLTASADEKIEQSKNALDMTNPDVLVAVDSMEKWIADKFPTVGKVVSYSDSIKKINQVWNTPKFDEAEEAAGDFGDDSDGESLSSFGAFGDDEDSFSSFDAEESDDSFGGSFGAFDDFADDDAADAGDVIDVNENYKKLMQGKMTQKDVQDLLDRAYAQSGGKRASLDEFLRYVQKEVNYKGSAFYEIPSDPKKYNQPAKENLADVISNYTLLLGDSMERFTDDQVSFKPSLIRVQVQIKTNSTQIVGKMLKEIEAYAKKDLPEGYYMESTGVAQMENIMTQMVVSSQITSLLFSLLLVFTIISLSFKSPVAGIIGAIPLLLTIVLNYMVMGFMGIRLDLFTSIIASVAVGVGIDYTIHFITEYKQLRQDSVNIEKITRETFRSSGMGIITNAIAVGLGFLVLCLSKFVVLRYIGILVALVMFTSSMLAMTILPAILNQFDPKFLHKGKPKAWESQ